MFSTPFISFERKNPCQLALDLSLESGEPKKYPADKRNDETYYRNCSKTYEMYPNNSPIASCYRAPVMPFAQPPSAFFSLHLLGAGHGVMFLAGWRAHRTGRGGGA